MFAVYKTDNTAVGIRCADHTMPSVRKKLAPTSPTSGGRSVGTVRSRTQATEFVCFILWVCKGWTWFIQPFALWPTRSIVLLKPSKKQEYSFLLAWLTIQPWKNSGNRFIRNVGIFVVAVNVMLKDAIAIYSKTCPRRNRKGPNIFSKLGNFPHYTKLQKKIIENQLKYCMVYSTCLWVKIGGAGPCN
jgi:hypothetical protein